jgi:PAS domain S-box-containing protein
MDLRDLANLARSAGDAAFVTDCTGTVLAWNATAESLFGVTIRDALGRSCAELVQGEDLCGAYCGLDCAVQQRVRRGQPVASYDIRVITSNGKRWCSFGVLSARVTNSATYSLHLVRDIDRSKRFELVLREFLTHDSSDAPPDARRPSLSVSPAHTTKLSRRELQILRLVARGAATTEISRQLDISPTTVNNHIQHILHKLNAHTRLQAVRRAEHAGLI